MKIKQLTSYPNPNELGLGNTNETYIRVENSLDVSDIFPANVEVAILDSKTGKQYIVKAKVERTEFRINKMGQLYLDYNVRPGDEIKFTYIENQNKRAIFFTVTNYKRVFLSVTSKGTEIVNIDNIKAFSQNSQQQVFRIPINEGFLLLKFEKSEKKRADSPIETDFFSSLVNDCPISKGNYYISLSDNNNVLEEVKKNVVEEYSLPESLPEAFVPSISNQSLQQIFYGAPGTGKSHTINEQTEGESVIRTTFHPDSDYSTFVGAYKPTMGLLPICDELGQPMKIGSSVLHKEQIIYEFVDQAFLQAYVNAWKYYADNSEEINKQYLIIEEINRGNCAQIFGDLFQLLDRNDYGFSVYPINADKDMKKHLEKAFKGVRIDNADSINQHYKGRNVVKEVLDGDILLLPNNLYIWATMNTSDQSLFPIDSAFKRRWEWQYMPIGKGYDENGQEIKWAIEGATQKYDWWSFLEKINAQVGKATQSEDKKLGFFFCKATDGVISAEKFVGKVIFYLWNDVFKNNGFDVPIFQDADKTELSFGKFYKSDMKGNAIVQKDKVELFLNNLGVEVSEQNVDREEDNSAPAGTKEKILAFWQGFNNARNENQEYCNIYNERKPLAQTFMDLSFGSSEYWPTLNAVITKSIIRCGIWIGVSSNKDAIYSKLKANETAINELVGARMIFTENTKTCSIMAEKKIDLNNESNWPEAYMWLMDIAIKIKKVKDQFGF